jgi:polysaccharide export outer membrane protein
MGHKRLDIALWLAALMLTATVNPSAQVTNYRVGPQDVLLITVFDQPDQEKRYTVEADGSFTFPYIGRVHAGGLTLREVEDMITKGLKTGKYFRNPTVSAAVQDYRSQRVFVTGEVRTPGPQQLTGDMTLIEVLSRAGTTATAGSEAVITRLKSATESETFHVDIKDLQSGKLSQDVALQDNDRIYIPAAPLVYVSGQVRDPGSYPIQRGMTVQQALSVAGGATDRGATNRLKVTRLGQDGNSVDVPIKIQDLVLPGDTIYVPEKYF